MVLSIFGPRRPTCMTPKSASISTPGCLRNCSLSSRIRVSLSARIPQESFASWLFLRKSIWFQQVVSAMFRGCTTTLTQSISQTRDDLGNRLRTHHHQPSKGISRTCKTMTSFTLTRNRAPRSDYEDHSVPILVALAIIARKYLEYSGDLTLFERRPDVMQAL